MRRLTKSAIVKLLRIFVWTTQILFLIFGIYFSITSKNMLFIEIFLIVSISGILFFETIVKNFTTNIPVKLKVWNMSKISWFIACAIIAVVLVNYKPKISLAYILLAIIIIILSIAAVFIIDIKIKSRNMKKS
ncbi:hypothetical protein B0S90_0830 [Caldicellulosiruptor bescii]|uniref:Uncharacterized protein n=2 Tax=Caldicellulosiruptor bescii TaxID=31899 RepID=B9MPB4_CALBD|nr:hypothetical protein [Caldicellulosiruptor bescii]ACM59675.1 hypothetical protein Athe_0549 [Caldicellulosiruptor bescii DSM 6725]PBC89700.1 hypothetical protein B0S87_2831 [Caldicellulosiruptor bescii]PBC90023.1 hypothetical protein B0S89_0333 [Caldicellulosiruptor bescii]PBD04546.1 hypothetical protein B0S85_2215 [Caldicellulosiruptor bescii]PBD05820.1 hypothetical protein B0S90_0830 [Caldicellulosiruptor bescii]